MSDLTPRGKALRWLSTHRGLTEQPAGSNTDRRSDGIRKAQIDCANGGSWLVGQPWCGVWCFNALQAAGVRGINSRMAAVAFIEDDARAKRRPYRGWVSGPNVLKAWKDGRLLRGDLIVLFGRGVHVATLREIQFRNGQWVAICDEGNTSSGVAGSQSDGGGSYRRFRPLSAVHGAALVDYPG